MSESLQLSHVLPVEPRQVYEAWLDSAAHSRFTGGEAVIDPRLSGKFTAWDGYISGETLLLEPYHRIRQAWRTTEFPKDAPDSLLEILFEEADGNTRITLNHTQIPDGQAASYEAGWRDYYFEPMEAYFKV